MRLQDKVAIVTGGGGHIGRGIVRAFVKEGAKVVIVDRYEDAAEGALEEVRQLEGDGMALTVDVADEEQVKGMVAQTVERFGRVDVLVNAAQSWTGASSAHQGSPVESIPEEWWNESFDTGARATWFCCKAVFPHMKEQGGGKIVNFASIAGRGKSASSSSAYAAAKGGIIAFTTKLALEVGPSGINVNAIAPSATLTERIRRHWEGRPAELRERAVAGTPLGRLAEPIDQANVVCFLASSHADFVTGVTIDVTGGA